MHAENFSSPEQAPKRESIPIQRHCSTSVRRIRESLSAHKDCLLALDVRILTALFIFCSF